MTENQTTAEFLWNALRASKKKGRAAAVKKLVGDKDFMQDLFEFVILEQRKQEPSRPLGECLADSQQAAELISSKSRTYHD